MDMRFIGFNLDRNKQIESYKLLENPHTAPYDPGDFFLGEGKEALNGSFVPEEEVYCIPYPEKNKPENAERFIKDMITEKRLAEAVHFPLRDLAFVYENKPILARRSIIEKMLNNPLLRKQLDAYREYHQEREQDIYNKVITAVKTNQGLLLFDDTARGLRCAEKYLEYICDNFFSPMYKDADKLQVYYFSTSNICLIKEAQKAPKMFSLGPETEFIPQKANFLSSEITANYTPAVECSMAPNLDCYREITRALQVRESSQNKNIGWLDQICKTGNITDMRNNEDFAHINSFVGLYEKNLRFRLGNQDNTLLTDKLEAAIKDTAKRILQNKYVVRGYELPKQKPDQKRNKGLKV